MGVESLNITLMNDVRPEGLPLHEPNASSFLVTADSHLHLVQRAL